MAEFDLTKEPNEWPDAEKNLISGLFPGKAGENVFSWITKVILEAILASDALKNQVKDILADEIDEAVQTAVDEAVEDLRTELDELREQIENLTEGQPAAEKPKPKDNPAPRVARTSGARSTAKTGGASAGKKTGTDKPKTTGSPTSKRRKAKPAAAVSAEKSLSALADIVNNS